MSLRHINIPSTPWSHPPRCPTYRLAERVQKTLQDKLLSWKSASAGSTSTSTPTPTSTPTSSSPSSSAPPPPAPYLVSFTPSPTFTLGRRQTTISPAERKALEEKTHVETYRHNSRSSFWFNKTHVVQTPRGGLTTYHGPGQILFWPVIDLRSPLHKHFTVREYVSLLEQTTIAALKQVYDVDTYSDPEYPGVWARKVRLVMGPDGSDQMVEDEQGGKLASLGVHLQRHVTGLGIAVNVRMGLQGDRRKNPWSRIAPCGHSHDDITTVSRVAKYSEIPLDSVPEKFVPAWANEFAKRLGVANAADPDAGPLVANDSWTKWMGELDLLGPPSSWKGCFDEARKRKH
ncbi:hypothetical protein F5B19DRAFT_452650 [Rostrohypoxylon terebratum]|nr:hypothetical protein F5B19DRAFT_452650 [Rostrohypoxylon terebratum]